MADDDTIFLLLSCFYPTLGFNPHLVVNIPAENHCIPSTSKLSMQNNRSHRHHKQLEVL